MGGGRHAARTVVIRVAQPPTPASLDGAQSRGGRERARAIAFYEDPNRNPEAHFTSFAAYKGDDVVAALTSAFHSKCAYCESSFGATAPVDVEHWRPKGGYVAEGALTQPGYYWLAADWTNLLPSCIDCNREREQKFPDTPPHLSGKANKFPLADERRRARQPGDERRERPLLLHPYFEDPPEHLEFLDEGLIEARRRGRNRSRKGRASIETYGLKRKGLVDRRRDRQIELRAWMRRIEKAAALLEQNPPSQLETYLRDQIREDLDTLERFREPGSEYARMADQMIEAFRARLDL